MPHPLKLQQLARAEAAAQGSFAKILLGCLSPSRSVQALIVKCCALGAWGPAQVYAETRRALLLKQAGKFEEN